LLLINTSVHQFNDGARGVLLETSMKIRPTWLATGGCVVAVAVALLLNRYSNQLFSQPSVSGATYKGKTTQEWVASFKSPNQRVRWKTLADLNYTEGQSEDPIPVLRELLNDKDPSVRCQAVQAIGGLGEAGAPAVPELIKALTDSDSEVRMQAAYALNWMGQDRDQAISPLIAVLEDRQARVRQEAANTLAAIGPSAGEAVPVLLKRIRVTEGRERQAMTQAVWFIAPETARKEKLPVVPTRRASFR
jgi:vesicle coat complex subunit